MGPTLVNFFLMVTRSCWASFLSSASAFSADAASLNTAM
jgi:hypothetical protein